MTNLVDYTYFFGMINIPNTNQTEVRDIIEYIVADVQKIVLMDALGTDLYLALEANYDPNTADKWKELVEGVEYEVEINGVNYTVKWEGLKNSIKKSLIAYFAFEEYLRKSHTFTTGIGEGKSTGERSVIANPSAKIVQAHNEGLRLYGEPTSMTTDSFIYYDSVKYYYVNETELLIPSLFNFIMQANNADSTTYPNWIFKKYKSLNTFGI